ncbi:MAG TPA: DNA repair protein RecO [Thermomicrobiaceae bacterium]|nr:DNA repair protein RecO [Thermomicrobiaceae bacterium]
MTSLHEGEERLNPSTDGGEPTGTASETAATTRARLYRDEAVVLRRRDLGEADRILTLFTRRHGKVRVVAKGVRKTKSRLAGHLEPYTRTQLMLARGRNLDVVAQAQLIDPYAGLRLDEVRIAHAGYLGDLVDALTVEGQEHEAAFDVLVSALDMLSRGVDPFVVARHFEVCELGLLGFRPELGRCLACGRALEPVENGFSATDGGVLCVECARSDPHSIPLSVNALKYLRVLDRNALPTALSLRLSDPLRQEIEAVLRAYVRHVLERDLGSLHVLRLLAH